MSTNATIHEMGNGLPGDRDLPCYVAGEGLLWRVVRIEGRICTGNSAKGEANYVHAEVEEADWDDCDEGDEFPARVVTAMGHECDGTWRAVDDIADDEATRRADYEMDAAKDRALAGEDD